MHITSSFYKNLKDKTSLKIIISWQACCQWHYSRCSAAVGKQNLMLTLAYTKKHYGLIFYGNGQISW